MLERCTRELQAESGTVAATAFGTSIYDETLYKAWSYIVHTIVPNAAVFSKHLTTFAPRGIGHTIALRLAEDGFDVAVNDVSATPELDGLVKEIESKGWRSLGVPPDVSLEPEVEKMVQTVAQDLGSLDVERQQLPVNACGTMLCCKHAGKQMIAQGRGGRIIGTHHPVSFNSKIFTLTRGYTRGGFVIGKTINVTLSLPCYMKANVYVPFLSGPILVPITILI
ncbi:NAD-binding protein [Lactarius indigo]|nr:NAD-binding protein [Lactarius indigo]